MNVVQLFLEAGPTALLSVVAAALAAPVLVAMGALSLLRIRVPVPIWMLAPAVALLIGDAGVVWGEMQVQAAIGYAAPDMRSALMSAGLAEALGARLIAEVVAIALFLLVATVAAAGHLRPGQAPRWTVAHAAAPVLLGLLASAAAVGGTLLRTDAAAWVLAGEGLLAALLLAPVSLRLDEEDAAAGRLVSARGLVATALFGAAATTLGLSRTLGTRAVLAAAATSGGGLMGLFLTPPALVSWWLLPGFLLIAAAGMAAVAPALPRADRRAAVDAVLSVAILLVPLLAGLGIDAWYGVSWPTIGP